MRMRGFRYKIKRNIGNTFVRLRQFQDAIQAYEEVMDNVPDVQSGVCVCMCVCVYLLLACMSFVLYLFPSSPT